MVFLKGVAMVGTMSTDIRTSSPIHILMLIEATSIFLFSGCLAPNDERQISSFFYDCSDNVSAKSLVRKEC